MRVVVPEDMVTSPSAQSPKYNGANIASVTTLSSAGHTNNSAPVHPVLVHAVTSPLVAFSTLPATVSLALGVVAHAPID